MIKIPNDKGGKVTKGSHDAKPRYVGMAIGTGIVVFVIVLLTVMIANGWITFSFTVG